jgi:hypothetical protein
MNEKEAGQILRASCFHILELFEKGFVNYSSASRTSQERLANEELQYQVEIGESFVTSYRALQFTTPCQVFVGNREDTNFIDKEFKIAESRHFVAVH